MSTVCCNYCLHAFGSNRLFLKCTRQLAVSTSMLAATLIDAADAASAANAASLTFPDAAAIIRDMLWGLAA